MHRPTRHKPMRCSATNRYLKKKRAHNEFFLRNVVTIPHQLQHSLVAAFSCICVRPIQVIPLGACPLTRVTIPVTPLGPGPLQHLQAAALCYICACAGVPNALVCTRPFQQLQVAVLCRRQTDRCHSPSHTQWPAPIASPPGGRRLLHACTSLRPSYTHWPAHTAAPPGGRYVLPHCTSQRPICSRAAKGAAGAPPHQTQPLLQLSCSAACSWYPASRRLPIRIPKPSAG
jgi:hypothetical protein